MSDIIPVNPETEGGIWHFTGAGHINAMLNLDSKIQLLNIEPYEKEKMRQINCPLRRSYPGKLR